MDAFEKGMATVKDEVRTVEATVKNTIRGVEATVETRMSVLSGGIITDVKAAIAGIPKLDPQTLAIQLGDGIAQKLPKLDTAAMEARLLEGLHNRVGPAIEAAATHAVTDSAKSVLSLEARRKNKDMEEMKAQYIESAYAQADSKMIYGALRQMGIPDGMAQLAASFGPSGMEWAMEQVYGKARTAALMDKMAEARMKVMPLPGVLVK